MKIGSQNAIPPLDWKLRMFSPQPNWKVATSTPYAAPTDSRFSTIALIAITIERNESSSRMNANVSTKPNTSGAERLSSALASAEAAVPPVTA